MDADGAGSQQNSVRRIIKFCALRSIKFRGLSTFVLLGNYCSLRLLRTVVLVPSILIQFL